MNELRRSDGRNVLWWAEDGGRGVCSSDVPNLVQKPVSAAQMQFTHATRSPQAHQNAGRVVCGSKVDIVAGISARDNRFFNWYLKSCAAQQRPQFNSLTAAHRTRCTLLRANYSHRSELAECFVLLPVVYRDGPFKTTPLTLWNPQSEMTPQIWYKSFQSRHK